MFHPQRRSHVLSQVIHHEGVTIYCQADDDPALVLASILHAMPSSDSLARLPQAPRVPEVLGSAGAEMLGLDGLLEEQDALLTVTQDDIADLIAANLRLG